MFFIAVLKQPLHLHQVYISSSTLTYIDPVHLYIYLVCLCLLFNLYLMTMIRFKSNYFTCIKLTPVGCRMPLLYLHINKIKENRELHIWELHLILSSKLELGLDGITVTLCKWDEKVVMGRGSGVESLVEDCVWARKLSTCLEQLP